MTRETGRSRQDAVCPLLEVRLVPRIDPPSDEQRHITRGIEDLLFVLHHKISMLAALRPRRIRRVMAAAVKGSVDEQRGRSVNLTRRQAALQVPANVPVYTWNLAGYRVGHGPSGKANRHTFGGLSDAAFRMVPLLEAERSADWPWTA